MKNNIFRKLAGTFSTAFVSTALVTIAATTLTFADPGDGNMNGHLESSADSVMRTEDGGIAFLYVEAVGNKANAAEGNMSNANILITATTVNGDLPDDLEEEDFTLQTILVPPGKCAVEVTSFSNYGAGAYVFQVVPIERDGCDWGSGKYDIRIFVDAEGHRGQAIASIEID